MIKATHHTSPIYLTKGELWETYELAVTNTSEQTISAEDVRIKIAAPESVETFIDKAVEETSSEWKPTRDLPPNTKIRFPINVAIENGSSFSKRQISVKISVYESEMVEDKQTLVG